MSETMKPNLSHTELLASNFFEILEEKGEVLTKEEKDAHVMLLLLQHLVDE